MRNKNRLGQITLFILLGIILLFVLGIGFYFISEIATEKSKSAIENAQEFTNDILPVKKFIEECLKEASIKSAYKIGLQGGYYILPQDILDTNYIILPYYY